MRSRIKAVVLASGAVGTSIAVAFLFIYSALQRFPGAQRQFQFTLNDLRAYMWPSSILMMATEGIEGTMRGFLFVAIAVLANGAIYALIGLAIWGLCRAVRGRVGKSVAG